MLSLIERHLGERLTVVGDRMRSVRLRWRGAKLGARVRIAARCVVQRSRCLEVRARSQLEHQIHIKATSDTARIHLGRDVFVGFNSEFDISERVWIGDVVLIAPGCFITDYTHLHAAEQPIAAQGCESKAIRIEDDVWLGAHVVVLPGVTIGKGAVVAAGAVVNRDVAPMSIVAGVPAREIGVRGSAT